MTVPDALIAALLEIERHVAGVGWDQPARLFALVPTAELIAAEPQLAEHLTGGTDPRPGQLSAIEQDGFAGGADLGEALARIAWPPTVAGVALSLERFFLPGTADADLPAGAAASEEVRKSPDRQEIRVVVGALRGGDAYGVARIRSHPDDLLSGADLVPGLAAALARTLD
ncbi:MAG: PPA1309 family protein [Micropruina sp.]|uniref:PPA1309 family protein n=1 Tax=Micropruina sp. TaxID=2737536 RepID=UPI0039E57197